MHPARFFAASNLGSFLGLLSYPFVFERTLTSPQQTHALVVGICPVWRHVCRLRVVTLRKVRSEQAIMPAH